MKYDVVIYCDGSADLKDGSGGWACVLIGRRGKRREFDGGFHEGHTNQTAELMSAILAFSKLKRDNLRVLVRSDSKYVLGGFGEGWVEGWKLKKWRHQGGERPNRALWETLESLIVLQSVVHWEHVKGHSGDEENERCDVLAGAARRKAVASQKYFAQMLEVRRHGGLPTGDGQRKRATRRGRTLAQRG